MSITGNTMTVLSSIVVSAVLAVGSITAAAAEAATFIVTNLNDSGTGSLRQAIINANTTSEADSVYFSGGLSGTITLASALSDITNPLSIIGPGAGVITVSGANLYRVFYVNPGPVYISGITISNGTFTETGGGIANYGNLTVANTVFLNNSASSGAGLYSQGGGNIVITDCTFTGNVAVYGGGAVQVSGGNMTITGSTFSGNHARYGGAIDMGNLCSLTVRNSTFTDNTGNSDVGGDVGGAIAAFFNSVSLLNNTFSGNHAPAGGALYVQPGVTVNAINNIFSGSAGSSNCNVAITGTNSHNLDFGGPVPLNSCNATYTGDPLLDIPADNGGPTQTMALLVGSAALNVADPSGAPATDQRGWPRPASGIDIGAYESMPEASLAISTTGSGSGRITSSPGGIDCGNTCVNVFPSGGAVSLNVLPFDLTIFEGWSGTGCSSTVIMNTSVISCTGTFTLCTGSRVQYVHLPPLYYASIMDAYTHSLFQQQNLRVIASTLVEDLNFSSTVILNLAGGYNCTFASSQIGYTNIIGTITISNGTVIMDRIVIL